MSKLKLLSLFSGIGAFEKALTNLNIDYELIGFSEIDKYAIESYCAIHNVDKKSILF
jgi:DNA (cytosine-5)-methyltransferase 1